MTLDDATLDLPTGSGAARQPSAVSTDIGSTLGRYVVLGELGRGGMGLVLRAYDPKLGREVAVKCIRPGSGGAEAQLRLVREGQAMAKLSHPHVVSVFDVDVHGDALLIAMEYVRGTTLREWLQTPRPWEEIVDKFIQSGRGLGAAHDAGLLHRDFKPGNVLVDEEGRAKVTDFGLATSDQDASGAVSRPSTRELITAETPTPQWVALTEAGTVLGTPGFMAPEQRRGQRLSPAVDQYAFCVSLWLGLTGAMPFAGTPSGAQCWPPTWPSSVEVPSRIVAAVTRGLAPTPAERWATMDALLAQLAPPTERINKFGRRAIVLGLAVLAAGLTEGLVSEDRCAELAQVKSVRAQSDRVGTSSHPWGAALVEYAAAIAREREDACRATRRGEQSQEVSDARNACLDAMQMRWIAASEALTDAVYDDPARVPAALASLGPPSACAELELQSQISPVDPRGSIIARADIYARLGHTEVARRWLDEVRVSGPSPPGCEEVQWWLALGRTQPDDSDRAWRSGLELAVARQCWGFAAEAALELGWAAHRAGRDEESLGFAELGLGFADVTREPAVHHLLGELAFDRGDRAESDRELSQALEKYGRQFGVTHPIVLELQQLRAQRRGER